jgi:hypothetical protein
MPVEDHGRPGGFSRGRVRVGRAANPFNFSGGAARGDVSVFEGGTLIVNGTAFIGGKLFGNGGTITVVAVAWMLVTRRGRNFEGIRVVA